MLSGGGGQDVLSNGQTLAPRTRFASAEEYRQYLVNLAVGRYHDLFGKTVPAIQILAPGGPYPTSPVTIEDVGGGALYLLSDLGRGVTGEILHIDSGYHVVGMKNEDAPDISVVKE